LKEEEDGMTDGIDVCLKYFTALFLTISKGWESDIMNNGLITVFKASSFLLLRPTN